MKESKDDTNRWWNTPCLWIRRLNIVKMIILLKAIYRFNEIPIKLPMVFFTEIEQIILQFVWKYRKQPKKSWERRTEVEESTCLTRLQSYSHQDSMVLAQRQRYRSMERNGLEVNPSTYVHLIFDKEGKNAQWSKDNLFNKWCWESWPTTCKRMKLEHFLSLYTKLNSKWTKYLNVRSETIKLLEENIGKTFSDINHSKILYEPPPRVMEIKEK